MDIHGAAKAKAVPVEHLEMVLTDGAGFAGFALWGFGMGPDGPDYMAVGDLSTLTPIPWMPGYARLVCNGTVKGKPYPYCSRVTLQRQLARLAEKGMTMYVGIEPEFMLLGRDESGKLGPFDGTDTLDKPCYDYKGLSRTSAVLDDITLSLRSVGIDVYQIDHEDANGQFEVNFTYADALKSADNFTFVKMAASEIARKHGMIATFMPKPFSNRTGSGAHFHISLGNDKQKNLFEDASDKRGLKLSTLAYQFLGGRAGARARIGGGVRADREFVQAAGGGARAVGRHLGAGVRGLRRQQSHRLRAHSGWTPRIAIARLGLQSVSRPVGGGGRGPRRHRAQARSG